MTSFVAPRRARAKPIMIQGTASSSGKSLVTAALCRIFHQDGHRVAPFKAQNMSNNSFVTHDRLEMGRAQVVQAYAAGVEPEVRMNPVLLKPSSDKGSQAVVKGKPLFEIDARSWQDTREKLRVSVRECYQSLVQDYDIVVLEGAGSPSEINLKKGDIVNMGMAGMADSPVLLVGDIDRGGVFASLVGTIELLEQHERDRVKGFIINKFRGHIDLLTPGLRELEERTGVPVLGVIPWIQHAIDEEDGVSDRFDRHRSCSAEVDICVIRLPHISNYTDFIPLELVPGVQVRWCDTAEAIGSPDVIVLPGTKATIYDINRLRECGIADRILAHANAEGAVLGICGGFQMLGKVIEDPEHTESKFSRAEGLGLLDMETVFRAEKHTQQTDIIWDIGSSWLFGLKTDLKTRGYEIHMGQSSYGETGVPFTRSTGESNTGKINGIANNHGNIAGTYLHGLFDSPAVVCAFINGIRRRKGLPEIEMDMVERSADIDSDINKLAETVRNSLDMDQIYRIVEGNA